METNLNGFDGMLRTLSFVLVLCYAILAGTLAAWLWVIPTAILFATATVTWCPIYAMFGWNSNNDNAAPDETSHQQ